MTAQYPSFDNVDNTHQLSVNEPADVLLFQSKADATFVKALEAMADTPDGREAIIKMACQLIDEKLAKAKLKIRNPEHSSRYFKARLGDLEHEAFAAMFLDSQHQVLGFEVLFRGTVDHASIHPREVVKEALRHNAVYVVVGHNHPSGNTEPSSADLHITQKLKAALDLMNILLIDHLIVGRGHPYSLAENHQI